MSNDVINVAICDDDVGLCKEMYEFCVDYMNVHKIQYNIELFYSGEEFLEKKQLYDILFLDVEMKRKNGFEVAKKIKENDYNTYIIFLTNDGERIREAFKVKAFRYILKSLDNNELEEALDSALREIINEDIILVKYKGKLIEVKVEKDIYYIEAFGDNTIIYLKDIQIIHTNNLKNWEESLSDSFFRCHKTHIINFFHYEGYGKEAVSKSGIEKFDFFITMKNGDKIPVSVRKRKKMKEALNAFIRKNAKSL